MLWGETLTHTECWGLMGVFQQNQHLQPDWFFWRLAALLARYRSMRICASLAPCQPSKSLRHLVNVISRRLLTNGVRSTREPCSVVVSDVHRSAALWIFEL